MLRFLRRHRYKVFGLIIVIFLLIRIGLIWFVPGGRIHVTEDKFYELQIGMTEEAVENILGPSHKVHEEETFSAWSYSDGMIVTEFENGKLKSKDFVLDPEPIRRPRFPRF